MACMTAPSTLRFFKRRGGTVASSCFQSCIAHHIKPKTANSTNRAIILGSLQSYFVPPHCKASRTDIIVGIKTRIPHGSMRLTLFIFPGSILLWPARESLKNNIMKRPVNTPKGRLIQKHHRQLAWSVSSPPSLFSKCEPLKRHSSTLVNIHTMDQSLLQSH